MNRQVHGNNGNTFAAFGNWATAKFNEVRGHAVQAHAHVQQGHLTFIESCAQGLNGQLKNMIDDGDVKAVKAILFNTSTVALVATVALYVLGSMSFLGAAVVIALSLAGRSIVHKSFDPQIVELTMDDESRQGSYMEPETLLEAGGYPVFYAMNPIIEIAPQNIPGNVDYTPAADAKVAIIFRLFKAAPQR